MVQLKGRIQSDVTERNLTKLNWMGQWASWVSFSSVTSLCMRCYNQQGWYCGRIWYSGGSQDVVTSEVSRFGTCFSTASEAVDSSEARCRKQRQETGSDCDPKAPAEVRVAMIRCNRSTVRISRETTKCRHRSRLGYNWHTHTYTGRGRSGRGARLIDVVLFLLLRIMFKLIQVEDSRPDQ